MKRLLIAFQFLTILPIRTKMSVGEDDMAKSSSFFVLVGLFQGILLVAAAYILGTVFHPDLATALVLLVLVLSNGGFHLDGLADTFDAISAKSEGDIEKDRQRRLMIMKDGSSGPAGVTAIVFALLLKYLSLKNVSHFTFFTYYLILLLVPVISKWAMVVSMFHGKPARKDGLGRIFIGRIGSAGMVISTLLVFSLLALPSFLMSRYTTGNQLVFCILVPFLIYILCHIWVRFTNKKFGGLTGDSVGALGEITEIIFLLMVIIWSRLSI